MKKEDKPLIVRWAEGVANLLWGYSDKSEQMAEQIQRLMQDAESFSEILDKVQVENRKLKASNAGGAGAGVEAEPEGAALNQDKKEGHL